MNKADTIKIKSILTQLIKVNDMKEQEARSNNQTRKKWFYYGKQMAIKDVAELLEIRL